MLSKILSGRMSPHTHTQPEIGAPTNVDSDVYIRIHWMLCNELLQEMLDVWYYTWIDDAFAQYPPHGSEHLEAKCSILLFVQHSSWMDSLYL
jgi:hypothetical protein